MGSKELLLNAKLAGAEAEKALNPHMRNAFFEIRRLYERLAAMEVTAEQRRFERKRPSDLTGPPREDGGDFYEL